MVAYATEADVYTYALPRGALGNPGRLVASMLASNSTVELIESGFSAGSPISFRAADGGTLSAPLVAGTVYYALPITDSTFQVSATPNGSPITLTTDGVSVVVMQDLPWAGVGEFYSRFVDGFIPAHMVPLPTPYPVTIVGIVAQLMAKRMQILSGMTSESMDEVEKSAKYQLERWAAGLPVRDAPQNIAANLSVTSHNPGDAWIGRPIRGHYGL
jgi:hypothetical protein